MALLAVLTVCREGFPRFQPGLSRESDSILFAGLRPDLPDAERAAAGGDGEAARIRCQDLPRSGVRAAGLHQPGLEETDLLPPIKGVGPRLGIAAPDEVVDLRCGFFPVDPGDWVVAERLVGGRSFVLDHPRRPPLLDEPDGLHDRLDAERKQAVEVEGTGRILRPDRDPLLE